MDPELFAQEALVLPDSVGSDSLSEERNTDDDETTILAQNHDEKDDFNRTTELLEGFNSDVDQTLDLESDRDSLDNEETTKARSRPPLQDVFSPATYQEGDLDENDNTVNPFTKASSSSRTSPLNSPSHDSSLLGVLGNNIDDHQLSQNELWEPFPLDSPPTFEDQRARLKAIQEFVELAMARKLLAEGKESSDTENRTNVRESTEPETEQKEALNLKPPPSAAAPVNLKMDQGEAEDVDVGADKETNEYEDMGDLVPMTVKSGDGPTTKRKRNPPAPTALEGAEASLRFRGYQEDQWQKHFKDLVEFKKKTGHCCVPHGYEEDPALARWVKRQRYQYRLRQEGKNSTMIESRAEALSSLGFVWDSHTAGWEERLYELKMFKVVFGHCNVPSSFPANPQLTTWVKCQRRQYKFLFSGKKSNLTPERIAKLNDIGFQWNVRGSYRIQHSKT